MYNPPHGSLNFPGGCHVTVFKPTLTTHCTCTD